MVDEKKNDEISLYMWRMLQCEEKNHFCHGYRLLSVYICLCYWTVRTFCGEEKKKNKPYLKMETENHNFSYFIFMSLADRDEYGLNNVNNNELDGIFIFILLISRRLRLIDIIQLNLHGEREPITLKAITENIIWYWNGTAAVDSYLNLHNFNGLFVYNIANCDYHKM